MFHVTFYVHSSKDPFAGQLGTSDPLGHWPEPSTYLVISKLCSHSIADAKLDTCHLLPLHRLTLVLESLAT